MSESNEGHEPEAPEATDAEEAKRERRVRRSRQIHTPEGGEGEPGGEAASDTGFEGSAPEGEAAEGAQRPEGGSARAADAGPTGPAPERRPRQRRRSEGGEPGSAEPPRGGRREPRRDRPPADRGPRGPRPPRGPAPRGERRPEGSAGLTTPQRKIYRQDVQIDPSRVMPPPARAEVKAAPKPEAQDKVTLILHPAPKAAPMRRSKKQDRPRTAKEALQAKTAKQRVVTPARGAKPEAAGGALKPEWVGADTGSAVEAVRAAAGSASALVQAWQAASNAAALARVANLEDVGGGVRKAARRALDILKAQGVDVPVAEREAEGPAPYVATFIPPDGSGATFLSISQRQAGGRYHVADVVMRPPLGIVHASSAKLAGKHIRDWRNRIEKDYGAKPVEVGVAWARYRIAEARKLHETSGRPIPFGFEGCKALLADTPETAPPHPIADLEQEPFDQAEFGKAILGSDAIHTHPEFRSWLPDKEAVDELLSKVGQKVGAEGAGDPKVVDEALRTETAAATDRFFTPELRNVIAERMRDAAISVRQRVGDETTRRILAVAKAVREAGLITSPPSEIPFLLSFFQKAVAMLVRQGRGQLRVPV